MENSDFQFSVDSSLNIQGKKHFVFNQTGNIMMSTTDPDGKDIPEEVRDVFAEVSVFFAGMTKAMSDTPKPGVTDKDGKEVFYTLYDYEALGSIVKRSGYFIHVTEQDLEYSMEANTTNVNLPTELVAGVLGFAVGGAITPIAKAMVTSVGKRADQNMSFTYEDSTEKTKNKVGNIIFVCEYIMGMPMVTAMVLSLDSSSVSETVKIGPCYNRTKVKQEIKIHKDTYTFVTPKFIKAYAQELDMTRNDVNFTNFIDQLQGCINQKPRFTRFLDKDNVSVTELKANGTYRIQCEYVKGKVTLECNEIEFETNNITVTNSFIEFKIKTVKVTQATEIIIKVKQGEKVLFNTTGINLEPTKNN